MASPPTDLDGSDLFELAPVALSVLDLDGRQLHANAAYRKLFGLGDGPVDHLDAYTVSHPDEADRTRAYLGELAEGRRNRVVVEKRYLRPDGTEFTGRLTATRIGHGDGRPGYLLGSIEDVTVEADQRAALEQTHRRLSAMLSNISDTVTLIDADGRVLDTTGLHTEVLGYPKEFWQERSLYDLTEPEDRELLVNAHRTVLERPGVPITEDLRVRHADGTMQDLEVTAVNLIDDPAVGGIVITSRNITDRKRTEAELARARDDALEQSRLRSEFVARVSHELRNQLHAVHGLTELLSSSEVPRSVRDLADSAHRQAEQFAHLVDDLLEYSRIEAGRAEPRPEPTLIRQVVADTATLGRRLARGAVRVVAQTDESVPDVVEVDAGRIRQVLANLVSNAAKFTDDGEITVRLAQGRLEGSPSLRFEVSDTGSGIAPEDLERIFRPFDQGSAGDPSTGTGLGLSITDRVVQLLGGRIDVDSATGRGTTFAVEIPAAPHGGEPTEDTTADRLQRPSEVLVVEDNEVNQLLVAEQLRRLGAHATVVGSGIEALEVLGEGRSFDCVLMDWQLPGLDGVETTRRIRAAEHGTHLPVIGLTASAQPSDRRTCLDAGMDDLLVKPVGLADLGATLRRWIAADGSDADPEAAAADLPALDRLVDDLGAVGPVRSIVRTYLGELGTRCAAVRDGIATGDEQSVRRTAHTLRSTSATLGATALDASSRVLETGPFPPAGDVVEGFERAAAETRDSLEGWLDRNR